MRKNFILTLIIVLTVLMHLFSFRSKEPVDETIIPIQKQIGKLNISIDPRLELLGIIQGISNYPLVKRNSPYYQEVGKYFNPFVDMKAVSLTNELSRIGFAYDGPVYFLFHLAQPHKFEPLLPYSVGVPERAGGEENLVNYQKAISEFAVQSRFNDFWKKNELFYNKIIDLSISHLSGVDWIAALEEYFNDSHNSYNLIFSPLSTNGYGFSLPAENGGKDLYACLPLEQIGKDNIPYLSEDNLLHFLWHEFCHPFVNHEVGKYPEIIARTAGLFEPLQNKMRLQAYRNWETCINEHIVRAINIRLIELYVKGDKSRQILEAELNRYFLYIEPILEKLREYEKRVENENIKFKDFVPELLNVFDSIPADYYHSMLSNSLFRGPVNNVMLSDKKAVIYPTKCLKDESLETTQEYIKIVFSKVFQGEDNLLLADTIALKTDLSDYGLVVYGAIENNLFLKKYESQLPFQIKDNKIIADREYNEPNLKLISCLPNPQNRMLGMVVYTAIDNKYIPEINNVHHGPEDYIVFFNRNDVVSKGFYKKSGKWEF